MQVLLDTQLILWWFTDDTVRLPAALAGILGYLDRPACVSQWEMAIKVGNGKMLRPAACERAG